MKFVFDIDGTICSIEKDYRKAKPIYENINIVNKLYKLGHTVWFYTGRGTGTGNRWSRITKKQLGTWGVKYHKILFQKPVADFYIDDKAVNAADFFKNNDKDD